MVTAYLAEDVKTALSHQIRNLQGDMNQASRDSHPEISGAESLPRESLSGVDHEAAIDSLGTWLEQQPDQEPLQELKNQWDQAHAPHADQLTWKSLAFQLRVPQQKNGKK